MIDVKVYNENDLCEILHEANKGHTPYGLIKDDNSHVRYLKQYLGSKGLNSKFYLVENDYISVDYLTDYSFYYSKSFPKYGNKCVRLHFFTYENANVEVFSEELKKALIYEPHLENSNRIFWDENYLGFIVVRPIPVFIIGYTILKHYNFNNTKSHYSSNRNYWGIKKYPVHVLGTETMIESLAFMSQDSNIAACATMAVWSLLQRAVESYFINLKSPYEITKDAGITINDGNRIFPNGGLDFVSTCHAITRCNLVTEIRRFKSKAEANLKLKTYVYAYSSLGLPIILGIMVPSGDELAGHAIAICGHSIGMKKQETLFEKGKMFLKDKLTESNKLLKLKSESIDKLYAHDDQWGPFAMLEFDEDNKLKTSWGEKSCEVYAIVASVFPKIRIPLEDIEINTVGLNNFINAELGHTIKGKIEWDIQLKFSSDFKNELQKAEQIDKTNALEKEILLKILIDPMPKYVWVATMYIGDYKLVHFIYDATGLRHTNCLLSVYSYFPSFMNRFIKRVEEIGIQYASDQAALRKLERSLHTTVHKFNEILKKYYI